LSQQSTTTSTRAASDRSSSGPIRCFDRLDGDQRVDRGKAPGGGGNLWPPDIRSRVQDLPLQIREIDAVRIGEGQRSDPGGRKELRDRCAQSADTDDERASRREPLLRFDAELGKQDVPAVAKELGIVQRKRIAMHEERLGLER
jgi:hypothetical protein